MHHLATHCLQIVHLTQKNTNLIVTEERIVRKGKNLREHTTKIINYEKKEMIPLTDEENKFYRKQKVFYICKK